MNAYQRQLSFDLEPVRPYSLNYFIAHSGVNGALATINEQLNKLLADPLFFGSAFVFGARGTGKTHLLLGICEEAKQLGISSERISYVRILAEVDDVDSRDEWVSAFISGYESLRSRGGLLLIEADRSPEETASNPHVRSRLLAGEMLELGLPLEEEFGAVISSLLERKNLKVSEYCLDYLIRRLPREPLSFEHIFASINDLSLGEAKRAGFAVVKQALERVLDNKS